MPLMQYPYQGGAKAGVHDSPKEGGEKGSRIQQDPFSGMNVRLGMRETCWGWRKEHHLYNTYLPIPSFLLSKTKTKTSLQGIQPTWELFACWTQTCCPQMVCRQGLELGAGNNTSCHPPSPLLFHWFQDVWQKRGCFRRSFLLSGAGPCARWGPESSGARSWLELGLNISHGLFTQLLKLLF